MTNKNNKAPLEERVNESKNFMRTIDLKEYGIIEAKRPEFPVIDLLVVPHEVGNLSLSYPAFGKNNCTENLKSIGKTYFHPTTGEAIVFRPANTSESISASHYNFENMAKPDIFDSSWLQVGNIVRTRDGVFTNTTETDEAILKQLLNGVKKVNGIYLLDDGVGFAPYETFETEILQDVDTFARGGLARALEHTSEKTASKLKEIGSPKFYGGVNVWGFKESKRPPRQQIVMFYKHDGSLSVIGDDWDWLNEGYAFGVLDESQSDMA